MTLKNFLKMHNGGCVQNCVSVQQEPYDHKNHCYSKTYFEEVEQDEIISSDTFKSIANKQVDHFNIIGGGMYKMELCIYLKAEKYTNPSKKNYWTSASWCNEECLRTEEEMLQDYGEFTCHDCERQNNCEFCENGGEPPYTEDCCKECINFKP